MNDAAYVPRAEFEDLKSRLLELQELLTELRRSELQKKYPIPEELAQDKDFLEGMEDVYAYRGTLLKDKADIATYFAKKRDFVPQKS